MKRMNSIVIALCAIAFCACATATAVSNTNGDINLDQSKSTNVSVNLNFRGWYPWGSIQAAQNGNTVTLNGRTTGTAGYVNEKLNTALRNKTVTLEITNAAASNFSEDRMLKITVNKDDRIVYPQGITDLAHGEYVPVGYNSVTFVLPSDFDGKLGFVFYQAELRDLQITATYR